jgi:Fe-S cluster assembly ATP-binding protein
VKLASQSIAQIGKEDAGGVEMGILIITHHDKLLDYNTPDFTHVMLGGRIVETGGVELARELYTEGYDRVRAAYPEAAAVDEEMKQTAAAV